MLITSQVLEVDIIKEVCVSRPDLSVKLYTLQFYICPMRSCILSSLYTFGNAK